MKFSIMQRFLQQKNQQDSLDGNNDKLPGCRQHFNNINIDAVCFKNQTQIRFYEHFIKTLYFYLRDRWSVAATSNIQLTLEDVDGNSS